MPRDRDDGLSGGSGRYALSRLTDGEEVRTPAGPAGGRAAIDYRCARYRSADRSTAADRPWP